MHGSRRGRQALRREDLRSNDPCWCGSGKKYKRCHKPSESPIRAGVVSPRRQVPAGIPKPDYASSGEPSEGSGDFIASDDVVARMRRACSLVATILREASDMVRPGVTTDEIDAFVHERTIRAGAYPSTLNYRGFPKSCCTSVN
ncbi:MAG: SEC-C metal-binding domain-containing protein, partial [Actinomycetota bacterium]